MNKHFNLIAEYCEVKAVIGDTAIYYIEDGFGYAEINGEDFSCNSLAEFYELCEMFALEDFIE